MNLAKQFNPNIFRISAVKSDPERAEVVRIKVKKSDGLMQPEYKKLCVDPQLTSFDVLRNLLSRAFNIKGEYSISYLSKDEQGTEVYLSLLSDWDLDAAFMGAADPYLRLKVDLKPFEEGLDDWDIIGNDPSAARGAKGVLMDSASLIGNITGNLSTHVEKTVSQVSKAMGLWSGDPRLTAPLKSAMSDAEFHRFLDGVGHLIQPQEFRLSVYRGGVEPSLRKVVWRHLLNVYPEGLSGKERFSYLQQKVREYQRLRDEWRNLCVGGQESDEIKSVTNMVKKDVLRTDRSHQYYSGTDDSRTVMSLFNLLVTYALTHPEVSYCQGMSDLAAPLLLVQDDEAHAYICFCGLMQRLRRNFSSDGCGMMTRFQHLGILLQYHDPTFHAYLLENSAEDMFFCYRWLLLELKREFPLDEALYVQEVMWSSLPPQAPERDLPLTDPEYLAPGLSRSPSSPNASSLHTYVQLRMKLKKMAETAKKTDKEHEKDEESKKDTSMKNPDETCLKPVISPCNAITPCDDSDTFDPTEFKIMEDSASTALKSRAAMIEHSLVTGEFERKRRKSSESSRSRQSSVGSPDIMATSNSSSAVNSLHNSPMHKPQSSDFSRASVSPGLQTSPIKNPGLTVNINSSHVRQENNDVDWNGLMSFPTQDSGNTALPSSPKRPSDIALKSNFANNTTPQTGVATSLPLPIPSGKTPAELNSCEEALESLSVDYIKVNNKQQALPVPAQCGDGNPFLMFLCLSLLLGQRDHIMASHMDYNELAMHYDKMVRRHNAVQVVQQARGLYTSYLKALALADNSSSSSPEDVSV